MPYKRNRLTGELVFVPDQARPPVNPEYQFKAPQAAANIGQTQASTANAQVNAQQTRQEMGQSAALFNSRQAEAEAKAKLAQLQAQQAEAEARSKDPLNTQALDGAAADAMAKLQTIDRIRNNVDSAWLPAVGFGAETMAGIGGTNARDVKADVESLKAGGALSEVLKMTQQTGKNPFTPMSNSDVELISRNTANLDQGQSRNNFDQNLRNYQGAYTKAYAGAAGLKTLNAEIQRLLPTIEPAKREQFRRDALARYNERMAQPRQPQRKAPSKGGPRFLGWED